ncbi:hypothetical protein HK102_011880, partial [Quaeritorhiza haematococci]
IPFIIAVSVIGVMLIGVIGVLIQRNRRNKGDELALMGRNPVGTIGERRDINNGVRQTRGSGRDGGRNERGFDLGHFLFGPFRTAPKREPRDVYDEEGRDEGARGKYDSRRSAVGNERRERERGDRPRSSGRNNAVSPRRRNLDNPDNRRRDRDEKQRPSKRPDGGSAPEQPKKPPPAVTVSSGTPAPAPPMAAYIPSTTNPFANPFGPTLLSFDSNRAKEAAQTTQPQQQQQGAGKDKSNRGSSGMGIMGKRRQSEENLAERGITDFNNTSFGSADKKKNRGGSAGKKGNQSQGKQTEAPQTVKSPTKVHHEENQDRRQRGPPASSGVKGSGIEAGGAAAGRRGGGKTLFDMIDERQKDGGAFPGVVNAAKEEKKGKKQQRKGGDDSDDDDVPIGLR